MCDKPNMASMMLSKPLDLSQHLTHIFCFSPVTNKLQTLVKCSINMAKIKVQILQFLSSCRAASGRNKLIFQKSKVEIYHHTNDALENTANSDRAARSIGKTSKS